MYAALLARRQAAAKLGGPNWEAKLEGSGDSDVVEVERGAGDRNSVFAAAKFQALVSTVIWFCDRLFLQLLKQPL